MDYFKKCIPEKLQQKKFMFPVVLFTIIVFTFTQPVTAYHPESQDCFYLPEDNSQIDFDGGFDNTIWNNSNWFTFGSEGNAEVKVKGHYYSEKLYLYFEIKDQKFIANEDLVTICLDPMNSGVLNSANSLVKYDIYYPNGVTAASQFNFDNDEWQIDSDFLAHINNRIFYDTNNKIWKVEIELDASNLNLSNDYFGLYFQVLDFINEDTTFTRYYWPISADCESAEPDFIPTADLWANGHFFTESSVTRPDIYFNAADLKVDNPTDDLQIRYGKHNEFISVIRKNYLGGTSDGNVTDDTILFKYANYGAACYKELGSIDAYANDNANIPGNRTITEFIPACSGCTPDVTLRTEFTCSLDAISSNNIVVRNMKYTTVEEGDDFAEPITVSNCIEAEVVSIAEHYKNGSSNTDRPIYYASTIMLPLQEEDQDTLETIYLYIDRSGLDTRKAKGDWQITFTESDTGESIVPEPEDRDLYKLLLEPGATAKFKMNVAAPIYYDPSYDEGGLMDLFNYKQLKARKRMIIESKQRTISGKKTLSEGQHKQESKDEVHDLPGYRLSTLRIKVYKEKQTIAIQDTVYHRMGTLGYFGSEIVVLPKLANVWFYIVVIVFILILLTAISYLIKLWKTKKWGLEKYLISALIFIFSIVLYYMVIILRAIL